MYDIAIIGAGPAGATLARLIARRYRVLLVDRRDLSSPAGARGAEKCCGGLLAPDAQQMLGRLGLGLPGRVLVAPQLFVVRAVDVRGGLQRFYQRHYINMDRGRFDRWLFSLVPPGVDCRAGWRLESCRRARRGFALGLRRGRREFTERARVLVGADGAGSQVRRLLGARRRCAPLLAVQQWHETPHAPAHFAAIFDPDVTDFYAWAIPKGDALVVGSAVTTGREARAKLSRLAERLRLLGFALGRCIRREAAGLVRPRLSSLPDPVAGDDAALIGEAAGFVSPSSAEGISYALRSAVMLAEALSDGPDGALRRYRRRASALRRNIAAKCVKARLLGCGAARRLVMASGLASVDIGGRRRPVGRVRGSGLRPGEVL